MTTGQFENPALSVDVVAVRFDPAAATPLQLAIAPRIFEPHLGELALPGVLMRAGERVVEAAERAVVTKLGVEASHIRTVTVGRVFDTPERDERGPTVSIACLAVIDPAASGQATWIGFDDIPALPFDHNDIVVHTRDWLRNLVWESSDVLSALLGPLFATTAMVTLEEQILGTSRNPANVHRHLDATPFVERTAGERSGRGRPQTFWNVVPDRKP